MGSVRPGSAGNAWHPLYYWVHLADKDGTPYRTDKPELFLSERSLQRRLNQDIGIFYEDLPVNPAYIDSICSDPHVKCFYTSRWLNGILIKTSENASLEKIRRMPFVKDIEYVKPAAAQPAKGVDDWTHPKKKFGFTANMNDHKSFLYSDVFVDQVNGKYLHDDGYLGDGILIAVLDAGYTAVDKMRAFKELRANNQIVGIRDFVNPDQDIYTTHTHGTYVLSVMAANISDTLRGTSPEADYYLIRTEDGASEFRIEEYNWLAGAELADSLGADIINSSLGYTVFDDPLQNYTYEDLDGATTVVARAAGMAADRGILVVNSAGNYGDKAWRYVGSPADNASVFSIGAVDASGVRTLFSSVGPTADGRIKPDVMTMGRSVVVSGPNDVFLQAGGTSFSAPVLSGMMACLWQKYRSLHADDIKQAVMKTSSHADEPGNEFGYGIPDFQKASAYIESLSGRLLKPDNLNLSVYPNPITQNSVIRFLLPANDSVLVTIRNGMGQKMAFFTHIASAGEHSLPLAKHFTTLPHGVYYIAISGRGFSTRVVKAIF